MKRKVFQMILIACVLMAFVSCDKNRIFEAYQPVSSEGWNKDSLATFLVNVNDTLQNHNILLNVRNEIEYKYSNLWLFVEISEPQGLVMKDTFEITLASPAGKWLGDGFGGLRTRQVMYRRNVYFPLPGEYKMSIQHGMRESILDGISDIGIRVEKTN